SPRVQPWSEGRGRQTRSASTRSPASRSSRAAPKGASARARGKSSRPSGPTRSIRTSRRATPERCGNGTRCAMPPSNAVAARHLLSQLRGPCTAFGLATAAIVGVLDQASKLWLLYGFDLADRGRVALAPVVELVLVRNYGISYGWFQWLGGSARWALLALTAAAVGFLLAWARPAPFPAS